MTRPLLPLALAYQALAWAFVGVVPVITAGYLETFPRSGGAARRLHPCDKAQRGVRISTDDAAGCTASLHPEAGFLEGGQDERTVLHVQPASETRPVRYGRGDAPLSEVLQGSGRLWLGRVQGAASLCNVPVRLLASVAQAESNFDPWAVSEAGAEGLMQLLEVTQREMNVTNPFDPWESLLGGACYLRKQFDRFGTWREALWAYNAGPRRVITDKVPRSTKEYAEQVLRGGGIEE